MSEFRFACSHCGQRISGDAQYRGTQIVCPACHQTLVVPAPAAKAPLPNHPATVADTGSGTAVTLALLSFVCSLALGVGSIPGIVLGHLARARLRRNPAADGQRLALAGLILSYSLLLGTIVFFTIGFVGLRPKQGRQITQKEESAYLPEALKNRLADEVKIGDATSEWKHEMNSAFSGSGKYMEHPVRDAVNGGFISYVLKTDPAKPMSLCCTYWGNDNTGRRFNVLVNDKVIATQKLEFNDPGRFFHVEYPIPENLTRGQTNVTVIFQAYPRNTAGGLYGCQMLKR